MRKEELRKKFNPDGSDLRRAQLRMLDMLKFVDDFCSKHNITYWLDAGTLLGAVRHGGFIPWDDDTDIGMPFEDYMKFKQLMLENNPSDEFVLQCYENDSAYKRPWIALRDLKSEYVKEEVFHNKLKYRGLQIDIFPMEKGVNHFLKRTADTIQVHFVNRPVTSKRWFYKIVLPVRPIIWSFLYRIVIPTFRKVVDRSHKEYYSMTYGVPYYQKRYLKDIFPINRIQFEGYEFNVPNNCDSFLTGLYSNWRQIPKDNEIHTHKAKFVFYDNGTD